MINVLKVVGDARHLELAINTGVFGGILIGLLTAQLYQRFNQIKYLQYLVFFGQTICTNCHSSNCAGSGSCH